MHVAYLISQGFRPRQISQFLNWPKEPQITRLMNQAREDGYIASVPAFNFEKCKPEDLAELENLDLSIRLCQQLRAVATIARSDGHVPLRGIRILPSNGSGQGPVSIEERQKYFSACVAAELLARIARSRVCGVTWGHTLAKAVDAVARLHPESLRKGKRQFIAICGEPFSMEALQASSSHIAESLNSLQGGKGAEVSTLRGIPAFIPPGFNRDEILRFIHGHTAYGRIFGKTPGKQKGSVISELDTVLTSVGTFEDPPSKFVEELMAKSNCDLACLKKLAKGDIGGVLIRHSDLPEAEAKEFARIAAMWIGVSEEDLKGVVTRSAHMRKKKPGVVVLAIGANKTDIIYEVVRRGMVSELFVDQELAAGLARRCGIDPTPKLRAPAQGQN
jgi:DNA-binding transcriptional regulator LsrR (DeoR family)